MLVAVMSLAAGVGFPLAIQALGLGPDFTVFWTAQHVADPYGLEIARLLASPTPVVMMGYPPTFLLFTRPLAWMAYPVGLVIWSALGGASLGAVSRWPFAPLLLISPAVALAGLSGQTSLIVGSCVLGGLMVSDRPRLCGLLLAIALCIKPQLAVFAPVGLAIRGRWPPLFWTGAIGLAFCVAATAVYGPMIWPRWITALHGLALLNANLPQKELALWPLSFKLAVLFAGLGCVWAAFRTDDPCRQAIASMSTSLLVSPHAFGYDFSAVAPALLLLAGRRDWRAIPSIACLILAPSAIIAGVALVIGGAPALGERLLGRRELERPAVGAD